jgi:arylsulfatase A-like enzyme
MFKLREQNVAEMLDWVEAHQSERFFLFWHHFEAHAPYLHTDFVSDVLPEPEASRLKAGMKAISEAPLEGVWPGEPEVQTTAQLTLLEDQGVFTRDVCEALYSGGVLAADRWFGRLVERLRELSLYDRTMIIVTSDHGEEMAERNPEKYYDVHGHSLYEEIVHVPLIIRLPGGQARGTRVARVTRTIDVMPTTLDVLGVPPATDEMQGQSLVPYWRDSHVVPERIAFTEALATPHEKKSVRTARYKYILSLPEKIVRRHGRNFLPDRPLQSQLFDLQVDPVERINLLAAQPDEATAAVAASLDRALREHVAGERGEAEPTRLDENAIERLRALGYVEP